MVRAGPGVYQSRDNYRRLGLGHRHMKLCNTTECMSGGGSQECENTTEGGNRHGNKVMS